VMIGACIAVALELCGISSLAFAVGVYIPMQYSSPIFAGGCIRWLVDAFSARRARAEAAAAGTDAAARAEAEVRAIAKSETSPGMLFASGLIAGGSLAGVLNAFLNFWPWLQEQIDFAVPGEDEKPPMAKQIIALCIFGGLGLLLLLAGIGKIFKAPPEEDDAPPPGGLGPHEDPDFHIRPV
jgi:OPT oligopeptide transporter protein